MSLKKLAEAILDDREDAKRCYNWRNSEFRVYYDTESGKIWGRYEHVWEKPAQTGDGIVLLNVSGYDVTSVKKSIRKTMRFADQGWRITDGQGRPCNSVDDWKSAWMKKF